MITSNPDRPVTSSWLHRYGSRLDASTFISGAVEARIALEKLDAPTEPLIALTKGHNGGIFNGPKFSRTYVDDPAFGVPFMGSGQMPQADVSNLTLLSKEDATSDTLAYLEAKEQTTLISCSGTIGRTVYTRSDMEGIWTSQHIMKVVPDESKVPPGYLFAYLSSRYGNTLVTSGTYGAIVQHIEPKHIADLPVPRLGDEVEGEVHRLVQRAAELRARYQANLTEASGRLFDAVGLSDITAHEWHQQGPDLGFQASSADFVTLRALNYNPRAARLLEALRDVPHKTLGQICAGGMLERGPRFKRIDADPAHDVAVRLVGQKQGFWLQPEGRWISRSFTPDEVMVPDETTLVAARGTLGENEVYGRAIFVTGDWREHAYTEDFLRVIANDPDVSGAYLFAFMRSETAFRLRRSFSTGSKQQDLQPDLIAALPVPLAPEPERSAIAKLVREAYRGRDQADQAEADAINLVETAIAD